MTKEEFIKKAIENRKNGRGTVCFDMDCDKCLYVNVTGRCAIGRLKSDLLDYIIDIGDLLHEKNKETNLEHYFDGADGGWNKTKLTPVIWLKEGCAEAFNNHDYPKNDFVKWLLAPYEGPKYRLTQFEYDFVWSLGKAFFDDTHLNSFRTVECMKEKGYLKDIPNDVPIRNILDNCEVYDE